MVCCGGPNCPGLRAASRSCPIGIGHARRLQSWQDRFGTRSDISHNATTASSMTEPQRGRSRTIVDLPLGLSPVVRHGRQAVAVDEMREDPDIVERRSAHLAGAFCRSTPRPFALGPRLRRKPVLFLLPAAIRQPVPPRATLVGSSPEKAPPPWGAAAP